MVSRGGQRCSICSSRPDVVAAVNEALRNRTKLRDLAVQSGFSRASLSRHSQKCLLRSALAGNRQRKVVLRDRRIIVVLPRHALTGDREKLLLRTEYDLGGRQICNLKPGQEIEISPVDLRESDILIEVEFEQCPLPNGSTSSDAERNPERPNTPHELT